MSMRSTWTGAITMGVMTFPVKLYAATEDKDIDRHNLHSKCKKAVNQIKVCQGCLPQDLVLKVDELLSKAEEKVGEKDKGKTKGLSLVMVMTDETMVKGYELTRREHRGHRRRDGEHQAQVHQGRRNPGVHALRPLRPAYAGEALLRGS